MHELSTAQGSLVLEMSSSEDEPMIPGPSRVVPVTVYTHQFVQLMSAITASQTRMDEKFARFQEDIHQGKEEAAAKAFKHACSVQQAIHVTEAWQ